MSSLWKLDSMKFRSIKASTTPAAAPTWYNLYSIGGTLPSLFADFTTEGASDHYYYSGSTYANAAAYETAVGLAESRSSAASYVNSSGSLASASSGVLRLGDYAPVALTSKGILLEGASTNIALYSGAMANSDWNQETPSSITLTANAATAPDGTTTAASMIETTTTGTHIAGQNVGTVAAGVWTFSVWAQAAGRTWIALGIYDAGEVYTYFNLSGSGAIGNVGAGVTATIQVYPNGWYRCAITKTLTNADVYGDILLATGNGTDNYTGNGTSGANLWGVQFEKLPFASSYIPTTSASASRAADGFKRTRTNPTSITKLIKATTPPGVGTEQTVWSADDGTDNNYIRVVYYSDGHIHVLVEAGGASQANLDMGAVAINTTFTLALTASTGNFAASINGGTAVSSSSGTMPTGLVNDRIGSGVDAGYEWFSDVAIDAEWTNLVASNAQLQAIS
jgi:hypothetical protein